MSVSGRVIQVQRNMCSVTRPLEVHELGVDLSPGEEDDGHRRPRNDGDRNGENPPAGGLARPHPLIERSPLTLWRLDGQTLLSCIE